MFNELKLDACGSGVRSKLALPLRVELWNGQHVDFSSAPARATIRIANPKALGYLPRPSLDSLGRAYVEGDQLVPGGRRQGRQ